MQQSMVKRLLKNSFWISLLLHLLLLIALTTFWIFPAMEQQTKVPDPSIPAYVYKARNASASPSRSAANSKPAPQQKAQVAASAKQQPPPPLARTVIENAATLRSAPDTKKHLAKSKTQEAPKSMLLASQQFLEQVQRETIKASVTDQKAEEPIFLVGDNQLVSDPLIKLLGQALSANFSYPRTAGELGIRGRVLVQLTLHPEGYFSDVQLVASSESQDLDSAALYAVNQAPSIVGVDRFLSKPTKFVVGFIFR